VPRSSRKRAGLCMLKRGASCLGCRKGKRRPPGRVLHPTQSTYFAAMDADGKGLNFFNGCVTGGGSIRHPRRRHWGRLVMHSIQRLLLCERSELYQQTSQQYHRYTEVVGDIKGGLRGLQYRLVRCTSTGAHWHERGELMHAQTQ
jgi:hypothetical protein